MAASGACSGVFGPPVPAARFPACGSALGSFSGLVGFAEVAQGMCGNLRTEDAAVAYGIKAVVGEPWEVVLGRVREALAEQGFEVLIELDLSEALRARLGVELPPQVVLGVSRVPLTYAALQAEPSVGVLLPWHVVVRAEDDSITVVEAADLHLVVAITAILAWSRSSLMPALHWPPR